MDTYVYKIGNNLYVNLTNRCSNRCTFCVRNGKETFEGYSLWLKDGEPSAEQVISALGSCDCDEVVFCGFGEPHGSIINGRDIAPELAGKLDGINISLNASTAKLYEKLCRPLYPDMAFDSMLFFAQSCKNYRLNCWFSVVDCVGEAEVEACRALAERIGVPLRVRPMID